MRLAPAEINLELRPQARIDVIDVNERVRETCGDLLARFPRALYCSYHTTAGYLEQSLSARLRHSRDGIGSFIDVFRRVFPPDAPYSHDQLHLRNELSEEQRQVEPRNADSHLAYMSAGLRSCVVYRNRADRPVYFVDLDGVIGEEARRRVTTVIGFHHEERVRRVRLEVPVSGHPVDSINLKDPRVGILDRIQSLLREEGIVRGRVYIALDPGEHNAGLTVNEYETLLMRHDLAEVLRNPVRFMIEKGRHMLQDPLAIPGKTRNYAKYDLVQVVNELIDTLGASDSLVEKFVSKFLALPAERFLRMKRSVSLLVTDRDDTGHGSIVAGTYQSPILVQWQEAAERIRHLDVTVTRIE
jgi:thiamine phosphate synthase YjbQ (UPF0047 family)